MSTIGKEKFQFVKRDDFASETIDAPAYSYWGSVFRQFLKKKSTVIMLGDFGCHYLDELYLPNVLRF